MRTAQKPHSWSEMPSHSVVEMIDTQLWQSMLRPLSSAVLGQLQRKAARDLPLVAALLDAKVANSGEG